MMGYLIISLLGDILLSGSPSLISFISETFKEV
jgi:hypothetical protein